MMRKLKVGSILKQEDLKNRVKLIEIFELKKGWVYTILIKDRVFLIKRQGKCEPNKCNSACCKCISLYVNNRYFKGFGIQKGDWTVVSKHCKFLNKKGLCTKWNTKHFPGACKAFPHPSDGVYMEVANKCSFKYIIIAEIKNENKNTNNN